MSSEAKTLDSKLAEAIKKLENSPDDFYRLPYKFATEHNIRTRPQLLNRLNDLRLDLARIDSLITLVDSEIR